MRFSVKSLVICLKKKDGQFSLYNVSKEQSEPY